MGGAGEQCKRAPHIIRYINTYLSAYFCEFIVMFDIIFVCSV